MNLHIVPDNTFINRFYANLIEAGVASNNRFVVRTNGSTLKSIKHDFSFAKPYTRKFDDLVGDTAQYDGVFIHQFSPLLYKWVATHAFKQLDWMVWGADLYNLPFVRAELYAPLTQRYYVGRNTSIHHWLYLAKVWLLHARYRRQAYSRVNHVLTWMKSEFDFACAQLDALQASQRFFFYENDLPYHALDQMAKSGSNAATGRPLYIVGNSATPELNHLDAIDWMEENGVEADLVVPLSYGDMRYAQFLMKQKPAYRHGTIRFLTEYMSFDAYLNLLASADGLIMNNVRPQGYGNILMMMYLGKQVFLNARNLSVPELNDAGLIWEPLQHMVEKNERPWPNNRERVLNLLSHEKLIATYQSLFG